MHNRCMCSVLVSDFLTMVTQHIHSLRASGVRSFHAFCSVDEVVRAFRRSSGTSCTILMTISFFVMFYGTGVLSL